MEGFPRNDWAGLQISSSPPTGWLPQTLAKTPGPGFLFFVFSTVAPRLTSATIACDERCKLEIGGHP
jgi:hypothetical protein